MNMLVFYASIAVIAGYSIWVGLLQNDSHEGGCDQYYLGGRSFGFFSLTLTILATQLGGGAIIGNAEAAYVHGWQAIYYSLGIALGLIFLAAGFGAKLRTLGVATVAEVFSSVYGSVRLRQLTSIISIFSLSFILVAIGVSARKFFVGLGFTSEWFFVGFWLVAISYTVVGGLSAVMKTDRVQVIFILLTFVAVAISAFINPDVSLSFSGDRAAPAEISWGAWLLMPFLFMIISQDMGQRCFAAKTPKMVSLSMFAAAVLLVLASVIPTLLGIYAAQHNLSPDGGASVLITCVQQISNPVLAALFSASVLMAILSTADSLICAVSSNIAIDFPRFGKGRMPYVITFFVGSAAMIVSLVSEGIIPIMVFAYELSACVLVVPVLAAVLSKKPSLAGAWASFISGLLVFLLVQFAVSEQFWGSFPREVAPLIVGAASYLIGKQVEVAKQISQKASL